MTQTREQLLLAKPVGISQMLVLLAKRVGISQLLQLVELEVRKLLCNYDFPDNGVPIVFGSALLVSQALMANPVVKDVPPSIPSSIVYGCQGLYRTRYNQVEGAIARDKIHLWLKGLQSLHHVLHNPLCFEKKDVDEEIKMIMFGDYAYIVIQLMKPIACELGMRFSIEEGKKKIAVGVISSIIG
ncbi:hypothetical protein V6N12_075351 [Hibiscus sabdariffa]|uniref:Translation elongation factor EFTu/EF1A C-terminal domain-containing protein n=1 Tax=Hibiscus sabdariffa TaxID=183260 RepID=A0ABR2C974_9ROSI